MNTPYYLIDEAALRRNLEILRGVRERTGCRILLAQKAFSMFAVYPIIAEYLDGATASGLFEARLAAEELQGENHVFSAAYRAEDIPELARLCDHVVFNSCAQLRAYAPQVLAAGKQAGLRINPECSTQEGHAIYDPCGEKSRLGVTRAQFDPEVLPLLSGLHFHTLCEQDSDALETTLDAVEARFGEFFPGLRWLNFGGGHHITRPGYDIPRLERCIDRIQQRYGLQVYLEPGEAVALNAGILRCTVLDIVENGGKIAITGYVRRLPYAGCAGDAIPPAAARQRPAGGEGRIPTVSADRRVWQGTSSGIIPLTVRWPSAMCWNSATWPFIPW